MTHPKEPSAVVERDFQGRVGEWMGACFTPEIIADKLERADRFIEEALELVQATGYSADRAHALVDYVFNRPVGVAFQEVGGVMVTLAALCNPHDINMDGAAETELARVWTKIDKIREKHASKPVGSALPVPVERGDHDTAEPGLCPRTLEAVEYEITAWAFANAIDGAVRNDLMRRIRSLSPTTSKGGSRDL
jgi:hypothetical protein